MLHIVDFFAPINLKNLLIFLLFLLSCEIIGYWLANTFIKKIPSFLRGAIWLLGLGLIVFIYFLSHFFVPLAYPTLLVILLALTLLTVRTYLITRAWRSLFAFLKKNFLPFLFVLIILPNVFNKVSLPPYTWDEMAYHYISPYALYHEKVWSIDSGFYSNLPRLLETAYIGLFSLTKTYSIARLFHFSIFVTFLMVSYSFLKQNFGFLTAIVFCLLVLFNSENFLVQSTLGYIDMGTMSFVIIAFMSFVNYVFTKDVNNLMYSFVFWGMSIGSKYYALPQFVAFSLIIIPIFIRRKVVLKSQIKNFGISVALFLILGGYWYIKNLITTENPIYPFVFGCHFDNCYPISLTSWTIPLTFSNLPKLFSAAFGGDIFLEYLFLASIPLTIFCRSKRARKMLVIIFVYVFLELLLIKKISGYEVRYFYHWQFLSLLVISLPLSFLNKPEKTD